MNEEEIINRIKYRINELRLNYAIDNLDLKAMQCLLDLYNKEKEKNKKLEEERQQAFNDYRSTSAELYKVIKLMANDMERIGTTDELIQSYFKKARGEEDVKEN